MRTPDMPVAPINAINSNPDPIVATTEVSTGETTSPVDETATAENHDFSSAPLNSSYNGGSSSDCRNSGPNRANDRNGNAFANIASDRRQGHFSGVQHQDRRTDPVQMAMAMSARFGSKNCKAHFLGRPN
jgi:hypothetical protein